MNIRKCPDDYQWRMLVSPKDHIPLDARISVGIENAAKLTGLSRSRIYELLGEGKVRSVHIGRRRLVLV